MNVAFEID